MAQLPADCLNEIFEYLSRDGKSLISCLLVNRLWCEIAVPIIWRNPWRFGKSFVQSVLLCHIASLPEVSMDLLNECRVKLNKERLVAPPLLFDYVRYTRILTPFEIEMIGSAMAWTIENDEIHAQYVKILIEQELYKMFINKCPNLKQLHLPEIPIWYFPGANSCFDKLQRLDCYHDVPSRSYFELAQVCRNLKRLIVRKFDAQNYGLASLIQNQHALQHIELTSDDIDIQHIGDALSSQADSLLHIYFHGKLCIPAVSLATLVNLRSLKLNLLEEVNDRKSFESVFFPYLEVFDVDDFFTPFPVYTNLISKSPNLNRIHWGTLTRASVKELKDYIHVISRCQNLTFVTLWYNDSILDCLDQMFLSCSKLEGIRFVTDSVVWAENLFNILVNKAPNSLKILNLGGGEYYDSDYADWEFTNEVLINFLDNWKLMKRKPLSIYINPESEISFSWIRIIEKYLNDGTLKTYKYVDFFDEMECIRESWDVGINYRYN
ncbi:23009_t:CDS:2 [Cetraspora pellucida]|uniref:23009_t:CDS:1 n=1 Tax=Cetraspora pellucida TaxID=1433469 RepID=A0A9N9FLC4_9GLOM|nr:23009_t:CDS:2 [Cetraspora pellucida]